MAHHEAINKARWLKAQKHEALYWRGKTVLEREIQRIRDCYVPIVLRYSKVLPDNANILEIGCGPTCTARFVEQGDKTYVDPLLDNYRRVYPGELPKGEYLCRQAENINKPDASFDLILSFNSLDHVMNPELVINEIERLLKPDGTFILGIFTCPSWLARLRYYLEHFFPPLRDEGHPYFYSYQGIEKTIKRHFDILEAEETDRSFAPMSRQGWVFICKHKKQP